MPELDVLRKLLVKGLFVKLQLKPGKWSVKLCETAGRSKLKKVFIRELQEGAVVLNIDKCKPCESLFKPECGHLCRCDYVLFVKMQDRKFALFVELKSTIRECDKIIDQFRGAECLIDYCDAALNRFHGENGLLAPYEKRFVVFYIIRLNKQPTRLPKDSTRNDTPERRLEYPVENSEKVPLKMLILS